jgi:CDP-glycerol glycerophosphotransferase (TagB/SpsB family)
MRFGKDLRDYFSKRARYGAAEFVSKLVYALLSLLVGWLVIVPLSILIPRKRNRLIFIGRENGRFIDNVKYLFIRFYRPDKNRYESVFLTEDRREYEKLRGLSIRSVYHPSPSSIRLLLTSRVAVFDHDTWVFGFKYFLLFGASRVQLWHGVGMKYIGLMKIREEMRNSFVRACIILLYRIIGLIPRYDLFISTSEFYTREVFEKAYRARRIVDAGYPRNDILFMRREGTDIESLYSLNTDKQCIEAARDFKKQGCKLVLYAPTFRDSGGDPITDKAIDLAMLNDFAESANLVFIVKFHPDPHFEHARHEYSRIAWYGHNLDVYPLFAIIDLLVTDYSAIFTDFLLLNRPIVFFPYDYEKYITKDRGLQFDYQLMTPGIKCFSQEELQEAIRAIVTDQKDDYLTKRDELAGLAFTHRDGNSADRIAGIIENYMSGDESR